MPSVLHRTAGRGKTARAVIKDPAKLNVPANLKGRTRHFAVYADPALGAAGVRNAQVVLARCERDYAQVKSWFGGISAGPFSVILFTYPSGAYHNTCAATTLYCDSPKKPTGGDYSEFLNVAEFVEVFESVQKRGWNCGRSNGEGLSRVLAAEVYPNELDGFETAATWLDSRRRNFVDHNYLSDQSTLANGCSALFLNWLRHQLGFSWRAIVGAGGTSLGMTYNRLTGKRDGFVQFRALLEARFPKGEKSGLATDNPFPL